jgi:hypothetical protein
VRKRVTVDHNTKRLLLDLAGKKQPRCWICGASFSNEAIDNYLYMRNYRLPVPYFIDVLKPRGLEECDLRIEIDHVFPFSEGGAESSDNLRLACGWCNRRKRELVSIYDVAGKPLKAKRNQIGLHTLPQPFWVVRLLGLVQKCEHSDGCDATAQDSELTVQLANSRGSANPANLRVVCYEHDQMREKRRQSKEKVASLWNKRLA